MFLRPAGFLPIKGALHLLRQISEAPEAARDRGMEHRDVKSANVEVTPEAGAGALISGLAKGLSTQLQSAVRPCPGTKWHISTAGGGDLLWAPNGDFLPAGERLGFTLYDVTPDGLRFVMIGPTDPAQARRRMNITLHWLDEFQRAVARSRLSLTRNQVANAFQWTCGRREFS